MVTRPARRDAPKQTPTRQATRLDVRAASWVVAAALLGVGCSSAADSSVVGALGRGSFTYNCVSQFNDDPACKTGSTSTTTFPSALAVGGAFKLTYVADDAAKTSIGNPIIKPASTDFLTDEAGGVFLAKKPGRVAVIARSSSNGKAADFTFLNIAVPTGVELHQGDGTVASAQLTLHVGDSLTLLAQAFTQTSSIKERLAGSVDFDWTTSSAATIRLVDQSPSTRMDFEAVAAGRSTLQATLNGLKTSIDVEVAP